MKRFHFSLAKQFKFAAILLTLALILGTTYTAFHGALDNQFVDWDDQYYVTLNPLILQPTTESLQTLWTQIISLNYHPLTMISLWVNARLSGVDSAQPFILTNVILHMINTALVFFLVMGLSDRKWLVAFATAILFGLHPMHVESVVWVSERKDVLYALFFLTSIITYLRYTATHLVSWLLSSLGLFTLACLSKAMAVSLVPCLFLVDYLRKRDPKQIKLYIEKVPFAILAILFGLIALNVQGGGDFHGIFTTAEAAQATNASVTLIERLSNSAYANAYYLKNFFLPSGYSTFHPYSAVQNYSPLLTSSVSLSLIGIGGLAIVKQWRHVAFGIGFYLSTIVLVSQIIPVGSAIVAERYTYLPYIGLGYILGLGLYRLSSNGYPWISGLILSLLVLNCFMETRSQVDIWQDHNTLFAQAVERYPEAALSRSYLASGLWQAGKLDEAIFHITYAIDDLGLETSNAYELLGNCYAGKGDTTEAITLYDVSVDFDRENITARYHRGILLLDVNPSLAIDDFDYCEQSGNTYITPLIYTPRGRALGMLGRFEEAISDFEKAIELDPGDIDNYLDRAMTYEFMGDTLKAQADYFYIRQVDPDYPLPQMEEIEQSESVNL